MFSAATIDASGGNGHIQGGLGTSNVYGSGGGRVMVGYPPNVTPPDVSFITVKGGSGYTGGEQGTVSRVGFSGF